MRDIGAAAKRAYASRLGSAWCAKGWNPRLAAFAGSAPLDSRKAKAMDALVDLSELSERYANGHLVLETLGPALFFRDDSDVFARLPKLRELGVAAVIYSSYDYGFDGDRSKVWDAANYLLGGGFDDDRQHVLSRLRTAKRGCTLQTGGHRGCSIGCRCPNQA